MSEKTTTTTYAALLHHSGSVEGETIVSASVRNARKQAAGAPSTAYAFYYFDVAMTCVEVNGEEVETASGRLNFSKRYYIDAEVLDYDAIEDLPGDHRIVLHYLDCTESMVLRCRTGNFVPYEPRQNVLLGSR